MSRAVPVLKFWDDESPEWPCARCGRGRIVRGSESALKVLQTADDAVAFQSDEYEPDWFDERFTLDLVCDRCADPVVVVGLARFHREMIDHDEEKQGRLLLPEMVIPPVQFFLVPKVPKEVEWPIQRSFRLFWSDPASSLNALRSAIEMILTDQGVSQKAKVKSGKNAGSYRPLPLHERIERYGQKQPALATKLKAVKWLGNAGSHAGESPSHGDVLDAYTLTEDALGEVYEARTQEKERLAQRINKAKGPPKKPRRFRKA
jgi:Domain of unknown function (DUF4145)